MARVGSSKHVHIHGRPVRHYTWTVVRRPDCDAYRQGNTYYPVEFVDTENWAQFSHSYVTVGVLSHLTDLIGVAQHLYSSLSARS
jgi:hypothetical protein